VMCVVKAVRLDVMAALSDLLRELRMRLDLLADEEERRAHIQRAQRIEDSGRRVRIGTVEALEPGQVTPELEHLAMLLEGRH
jgi:hypothetical protein